MNLASFLRLTNKSFFRCSNPIGTVRLGKGEPLVQGQTYSMSLMLEVPDTQANEEHGMFMSCLSIASRSGVMIDRSCKSSMLEYRLVFSLNVSSQRLQCLK